MLLVLKMFVYRLISNNLFFLTEKNRFRNKRRLAN